MLVLLLFLTAAAVVVVIVVAFPSPRQRLSKIGCNKMPPPVGYVLAGEMAAVTAVYITPAVAKSYRASDGSEGEPRFVDCVNFFASKNRDFVRCGLQTMSPFFSKISSKSDLRCRSRTR